jgi:hypothetical protein
MIFWSIRIIIISVIFIYLIHSLFLFFKDTLTTPKIKDLVNIPNKYQYIQKIIEQPQYQEKSDNLLPQGITEISNLPTYKEESTNNLTQTNTMKNELMDFLKKQ